MTKTFKTSAIFFVTGLWLVLARIVSNAVSLSDNLSDWVFTFAIQTIGLGAIPLLAYKLWVKESIVKGFSLRVKLPGLVYVLAIGVGITLSLVTRAFSVLWQGVAFAVGFVPVNSVGTIFSSPEVLPMTLICTAVLPAIFEELTYRGLGMATLETVEDERMKIIMLALLFSLGHQFILQTGYTFIAGLAFAFIAVKTRSILPGMIIHFVNNGLSVVGEWAEQRGNAWNAFTERLNGVLFRTYGTVICVLIVSSALTVGLLILIKRVMEKKKSEDYRATYYSPTTPYIDDVFGKSFYVTRGGASVMGKRTSAWYEYAFLYAWVALTVATTVISLVWGVMR